MWTVILKHRVYHSCYNNKKPAPSLAKKYIYITVMKKLGKQYHTAGERKNTNKMILMTKHLINRILLE